MDPRRENLREWERFGADGQPYRNRDFFIYEAQATTIAAGGVDTDTIQIQADAHFVWQKAVFEADLAGVAQTESTRIIPNVNIQITDTGSNRQLFFNPVPIPNVFGMSGLPFILPNPRLFVKTSTIQIDFTSFEVAATPTIRLSFIGYKFYKLG